MRPSASSTQPASVLVVAPQSSTSKSGKYYNSTKNNQLLVELIASFGIYCCLQARVAINAIYQGIRRFNDER
jgi:hypothetical protein